MKLARALAVAAAAALTFVSMEAASAQCGGASWYALHSRTASGERMNPEAMTAAHRSLPFGTKVTVEDLKSGRAVTVRINDRGPFVGGRVIDLSSAAAKKLGFRSRGLTRVRLTVDGREVAPRTC
ncbi:septal ring lytic transglycosylase RlpA family protein [Propylenella binzhouense]|uniref:Endolytic peptidoglycan transglycosylase RlpA n=1 Tax=Propylenella binzhouense TaxID=2555902 RepID=A0A964T760_9HYPH|nr:septal ring lytic transglycosylase RlpA family protein [Propylenella binzhouense]MYZ49079.1 septal ring lytic transglycosylase RlpA family protein [Propylenella binzhouense]